MICHCYDTQSCLHYQRMSNHYSPVFTDQQVLTIYLASCTGDLLLCRAMITLSTIGQISFLICLLIRRITSV
jgi:hypothetical protein